MRSVGWSSQRSDRTASSAGPAAPHGLLRHKGHAQAYGHTSRRAQRQSCAQPILLSADSSEESSENKWNWRNLKRGWLQGGAGVSCAAVMAANVVPLLAQFGGNGGSGDGHSGGGEGGGGGDGPGGRNHLYDLAEDAAQGCAVHSSYLFIGSILELVACDEALPMAVCSCPS